MGLLSGPLPVVSSGRMLSSIRNLQQAYVAGYRDLKRDTVTHVHAERALKLELVYAEAMVDVFGLHVERERL